MGSGHGLDHLTPVERTLLLTLCGRAADARSPFPVLGDTVAATVADTIDESVRGGAEDADLSRKVAIRTAELDRHVRNFVTAHPDATVVDLGCGLDTRVFRLDPPPGVDVYCLDTPAVIELRRRLLPEHERETTIAAVLEDPQWVDAVPPHRPTIIVADGVLTFLDPSEADRLLTRLTAHFEHGELVCQANIRFLTRNLGRVSELRKVGVSSPYRGFGIDEPTELEAIDPDLQEGGPHRVERLVGVVDAQEGSTVHGLPVALLRAQADAAGLPLDTVVVEDAGLRDYRAAVSVAARELRGQGSRAMAFGDLASSGARIHHERLLGPLSLEVVEPLWSMTSEESVDRCLRIGIEARVVVDAPSFSRPVTSRSDGIEVVEYVVGTTRGAETFRYHRLRCRGDG